MSLDTASVEECMAYIALALGEDPSYVREWLAPSGSHRAYLSKVTRDLDSAAGCLPPDWVWCNIDFGDCTGNPPTTATAHRKGQCDLDRMAACEGETELLARFRCAAKAWMMQVALASGGMSHFIPIGTNEYGHPVRMYSPEAVCIHSFTNGYCIHCGAWCMATGDAT